MKTYGLSSRYIDELTEKVSLGIKTVKEAPVNENGKNESPFRSSTAQVYKEENLQKIFGNLRNFQSLMGTMLSKRKKTLNCKTTREIPNNHQLLEDQIERYGLNRDSYF